MIIKKTGKLKSIGIAAGVVGIFLGMQILIGVIFGLMGAVSGDYNAMMDSLYGNASLITAVADLAAAAVILLIFLCRGKNPFYEVGFRKVRFSAVAIAVLLGILMLVAVTGFLALVPEDSAVMQEYGEAAGTIESESVWIQLLATVLVAPLVEEILFRGMILSRLKRSWSIPLSVLFSSLIFGVMHGQILWIIYAAATGAVLGIVFVRYNSIVPTIALHFTFNLLGGITFSADLPMGVFLAAGVVAFAAVVVILVLLFRRRRDRYVYERELDAPVPGEEEKRPMIEVRGLRVRGDKNTAKIQNADFYVNTGDCFGILGDFNDGRSTLVNTLLGLRYYSKGQVTVGGYDLTEQAEPLKEHMGLLLAGRNVHGELTPANLFDMSCGRRMDPQQRLQRREELFCRYGLAGTENTPVRELRPETLTVLSMVLSLAKDPEIVFFDDNGQVRDPQTAAAVKMFLGDVKAQGKTLVIASRHRNLLEQFCNRAAVLNHGTVSAVGTMESLVQKGIA